MRGPCIIIAASGMCEGGRILHHLRHTIEDEANIVAIVGFQAEHTLGRKLVGGWDTVPIFGVPMPRGVGASPIQGLIGAPISKISWPTSAPSPLSRAGLCCSRRGAAGIFAGGGNAARTIWG